jgi:D-glycero-D-manno-heptose 1,7-bisphosphate phosphatase
MVIKAVFLDRDGVINANVDRGGRAVAPTTVADFSFLPGVCNAVAQLRAAGFLVVVVTNQPDVTTGRTSRETLEAMHAKLRSNLPVDDIKVCMHVDSDRCECRKPKPGLMIQAAAQYGVDLSKSYIVGDRWRDVEAGRAAGCSTILVDAGYPEERPVQADCTVRSLPEAVSYIMNREKGNGNGG